MNNEEKGLHRRAALHAVLADPVRLHIVDLLTLGDRSPSELRAELDITSNLLAHHLGVLERQGLIARHRSEGDRRRSYVGLQVDAFDDLLPTPALDTRRIMFVCTGNTARSPMATALWSQVSSIPAQSAGTHPADGVPRMAIRAAQRFGVDLGNHRPRLYADRESENALVVTVCDRAHEELGRTDGLHWSVPSPASPGTEAAYATAFSQISANVDRLAQQARALTDLP